MRILSFDQNFTPQAGPAFQANGRSTDCASDMAVGNFDHTQPNPLTPPATIANPNLQVAAVFSDCGNTVDVRILNVDPANQFQLSFASAWIEPLASAFQATLATVDLQGRSRRVGPPDIVTINNRQQATLILAAPPMHVDAVVPVDGKVGDAPQPTNITGVPDGLYGGYTFSGTSDHNTNTTRGLTWSFSAQESFEGKETLGDCDEGTCLSVSDKFTAKQALKGSTDSLHGTYLSNSTDFDVTTGFSDLVSYKNETLTIYVYPVIGQKVCPAATPTAPIARRCHSRSTWLALIRYRTNRPFQGTS